MRLFSNHYLNYSLLRRYGIAVLSVLLVLLLKWQLTSIIPQKSACMLCLAAVMVSTWYGGLGPGLLATALAALLSDYFFIARAHSLLSNTLGENLELGLFVLQGVLISVVISKLQVAKHRAEVSFRKAHRHQESLRQSEERFRLLVEDVEDYAIFMLDPDGRVASWNIGAERIFGFQEAEIIGQFFSCIYSREDIQNGRPEYVLQKAIADDRMSGDCKHVRKDGSQLWSYGVITCLRDEAGNIRGFSKIIRDRTKTKQAQEALLKSEERLRLLVENVKDYAIFMLNQDGRVASWNIGAERILGYQEAEIIGQFFSCFFTPEAIEESAAEIELSLAAKVGQSQQERWHVRKDGTQFWAHQVTTALRDETGNLRGFSKVMHDISERKRIEEERAQLLAREQAARAEAEAANRTKDEFLSIVSHELRTPIAAILLWAELLQAKNVDSTTASGLKTIVRNAKSQSQLIEDLLDNSRIITGNLRLDMDLIDLIAVIQAAIDTLVLAASAKKIHFHSVLNTSVGKVVGDAARLQQVISNLLSNAIKFTPNDGQVKIRLTATDSQACIIISDTGQGINSEFLPYIFERFRQANSSPTRAKSGLGLGLAIVRHLVELHGGTVSAQSPGEGQGATFTVTLPLAVKSKTSHEERLYLKSTEDTVLCNSLLLDGLLVLIVDDEADMRFAIATILQRCGASVMAVASAVEALSVFTQDTSSRKPDVLLSDIGMPEEDGYTLLNQVRALPADRGGLIPAAALTAYVREEDCTRACLAGFQIHVPKPINPTELIAVVVSLARRTGKI